MSYFHRECARQVIRFPRRIFPEIARWIGIELNPTCGKEKLIAGMGGSIAIFLLILITGTVLKIPNASALIASMGASAVLLFAVPHGQLSQPWPVISPGMGSQRWSGSPAENGLVHRQLRQPALWVFPSHSCII